MNKNEVTERLSRRLWAITNMDKILEEASYHREHKADFTDDNDEWWSLEDEEAEIKYEIE